jgi:hypothetical protein
MDGIVWAAWAQVCAVALTGGAAVFVGWTQLRRFNENERAKTTVKYMNLFSNGMNQIPNNVPLTVETAVAYLDALLHDGPLLTQMRDIALKSYLCGGMVDDVDASADLKQKYLFFHNVFVVAANYMSRTAGLSNEGLIDGRLFLDFYGAQVVTVWNFIKAFADVDPGARALKERAHLRQFAQDASQAFVSEPKPAI